MSSVVLPPGVDLDIIIGALEAGTWTNSALFMLEITQVVSYFQNYPRDPIGLKAVVTVCVLLDAFCTVCNCITVYGYTVTNWGVVSALFVQPWTIVAYLVSTGLVETIVQTFLIRRYCTLVRNWYVGIPLVAMSITALGGSFGVAVKIAGTPDLAARATLRIFVIIWFVIAAALDVIIATLLLYQLQTTKTGFKATQSLANRLSSISVQTGAATSVVAVITLVLYLVKPDANIAVAFGQNLGRVYTLTMLYNLNIRNSIRKGESTSYVSAREGVTMDGEAHNLSGIHVHRTALVHMDETPAYGTKSGSKPKRNGSHNDDGDSESFSKVAPFA